jgi:DNA-binding YbaB/EbfC family protein
MGTFGKLKQFKDLRNQAKSLQAKLAEESAQGVSGGITITMNGNQEITNVAIDDTELANKAQLEKNIQEALNKAVKNVQKVMASKMKEMGDFDLGSLLGGK